MKPETEKWKQMLLKIYTVEEGSAPTSLEDFLSQVGPANTPAFRYPTSSVDRNMYTCSWAARAVKAGLFDEHWETNIEPRVAAKLRISPYTNWSGD